jgi:hypothetical protein
MRRHLLIYSKSYCGPGPSEYLYFRQLTLLHPFPRKELIAKYEAELEAKRTK